MERSYKYLGYFLLLMLPLIFFAFYKPYISKFPDFGVNFDKTKHIHAFIASLWVLTLILQPFFIINKKIAWHRTIGKASYVLFPLLIFSFLPGIIKLYKSSDFRNMFFPVGDCIVLIILYSLAIYYRKKPVKHMRFIIASTLTLLGPTVGRILPIWFGMGDVSTQTIQYLATFGILLSLILYDRKNKRNFKPYVIATYLFAAHAVVFYILFYEN
ncbi:MAG: hypothetical protein QM764_13655 [Chitinophagaceae bacterium]